MNSLMRAQSVVTDGSSHKTVSCDLDGRLRMGGTPQYLEFVDGGSGAYVAGDSVGAKATITGIGADGSIILESIFLEEDSGTTPELLLLVFGSPTNVAATDNAAFTWGALDVGMAVVAWCQRITAADWQVPVAGKAGVAALATVTAHIRPQGGLGVTKDLDVVLVAMGGYTLGAGKKVRVILGFR